MKKKTWLIIVAVCILLILSALIILANRPTPQDEMMNMLNRVENALGDEWKKQTVTKVSDLVYSDDEGNTIVYHVCATTYYEADSTKQTGINTDAISAVISPDETESSYTFVSADEVVIDGVIHEIYRGLEIGSRGNYGIKCREK